MHVPKLAELHAIGALRTLLVKEPEFLSIKLATDGMADKLADELAGVSKILGSFISFEQSPSRSRIFGFEFEGGDTGTCCFSVRDGRGGFSALLREGPAKPAVLCET